MTIRTDPTPDVVPSTNDLAVAVDDPVAQPTGAGEVAAALLAAAVASCFFGLSVVVAGAVPAITAAFSWWPAIGPLGGEAVVASAVYLGSWLWLHHRMRRRREVDFSRVMKISFSLIAAGLALTFPPVWALLLFLEESLF